MMRHASFFTTQFIAVIIMRFRGPAVVLCEGKDEKNRRLSLVTVRVVSHRRCGYLARFSVDRDRASVKHLFWTLEWRSIASRAIIPSICIMSGTKTSNKYSYSSA
jgi:hypothetical protein